MEKKQEQTVGAKKKGQSESQHALTAKPRDGEKSLQKGRIHALDLLRGAAVFLAVLEHYSYVLTVWYSSYLRVSHFNDPDYASHQPLFREGRLLEPDATAKVLMQTLAPWVNHLYLFLAAFNIALKDRENVRAGLRNRLGVFFALFLFFTLENAITSASFGESWSIYPLQMWMIVLSLLHVLYALWGARAVSILFALSLLRFVLPVDLLSDGFQEWMRLSFARTWEYDSRLGYFAGTGALGLLFGALYSRRWDIGVQGLCLALGALTVSLFVVFGDWPQMNLSDFYAVEHFWIKTLSGSLFVYACCVFVTSVALSTEIFFRSRGLRLWIPILSWVGIHSLFYFAFHRILFIFVQIPAYEWWLARHGQTLAFNTGIVAVHVLVCFALTYGLQRLRVFEVVALSGQPKQVHTGEGRSKG